MNGVAFCLVGSPTSPAAAAAQNAISQDGGHLSNSPPSKEPFTWVGPRTLAIRKTRQGFGFTLRHFIVYPPESAVHASEQGENVSKVSDYLPLQRMEPMDTIFVKNVKDGGPAQQAGLCTGDRLVKVNGESIIGKTYSQVIALIQNSEDVLELSIMPRDEDILQLAYSQDAYLKGNAPYRGGAHSIPAPPPAFYPWRGHPLESASGYPTSCRFHQSNCEDFPSVRSPMHNETPATSPAHRNDYSRPVANPPPPPRPYMASPAASDRFRGPGPPYNSAYGWTSRHRPEQPNKSPFDVWEKPSGPRMVSQWERHQALCNWMSQQTPHKMDSALPPRRRSASQDRLGEVTRQGHQNHWPQSVSQDTLHYPLDNDSWSHRAQSDNYLSHTGRSMEKLELSALISPPYERSIWSSEKPPQTTQKVSHPPTSQPVVASREVAKSATQHSSSGDSGYIGYRSYSPSFQRRTEHLHAFSFRETGFSGLPTFKSAHCPRSPSPPERKEPSTSVSSTDDSSATEEKREEVVLRQKPPSGRKPPASVRQVNVLFPEEGKDVELSPSARREDMSSERPSQRVPPLPFSEEPLASIPFIDEPTSPSIDLRAKHVPASCVVSSAISSAPIKSTSPSSPTFSFSVSRHYSQDCSSIKSSRRSSYHQAITTERSKSCDDGLNTFRDEGRLQRKVVGRVPSLRMLRSFFTDGSLDSLVASEDGRSKCLSASELSDTEFSDVYREGWLLYKQLLTSKGKKVGSGLRQWKRMYSILRPHFLFLHKERPESRGLGIGEEEQPISILGSLVDISYSETKRKHVFRLTTPDFCEYLFQAEDRDDMLSWVKAIRENSRIDGEDPSFANHALIKEKLNEYRKLSESGAKLDTSPKGTRSLGIRSDLLWATGLAAPRSPKQDGAVKAEEGASAKVPWGIHIMKKNKKSPPRAFGVRLEDCQPAAENKGVPLIVELCCTLVEENGLEYLGIYRVPGNNAVVSSLQEQLNKGLCETIMQDQRWQDLNVISSLLKSFFRKLPEPLFTDDKYNEFIEANRLENSSERMKKLRKLIQELPVYYYETLRFLVRHLKTVADHAEKNKMEPRNLALVFGPTLVRTSEDNMTDMVTHMPDRYKIVETLIQHSEWFFSDEKAEKTPVDESDSQSVPNIEHLLPNIGRTVILGDTSDSTNSDSAKAKASRKELYARDLLSLPFISVVNRKRRKWRDEKRFGSSTEEDDSEQEATRVGQTEEGADIKEKQCEPREFEGPECPKPQEQKSTNERDSTAENKEPVSRWTAPVGERIPADARSIVSGYSTLSTLCSEPASSVRGGDEADDERSEFSHMETDTEVGGERETERPHSQDSFTSQRLIPGDTLARKKLGKGKFETSDEPGSSFSRTPQRTRTAVDDLCVTAMRKPGSPETRRRKSAWRRHTVVLPGQLTDLNFNDWKDPAHGTTGASEPGAGLSGGAWTEGKDSGLSSLESQKAKTATSQESVTNKGAKSQYPPLPGLRHYL